MVTRCLLANAYEKDFCFGQTITWVHSHSRSWSNVLTLAILLWSILVEINKVISCDILWQFISYVFFFLVLLLLKNGTCMFVFITQLLLGTIKSESQHTVVCVEFNHWHFGRLFSCPMSLSTMCLVFLWARWNTLNKSVFLHHIGIFKTGIFKTYELMHIFYP